MFAKFFKMFSPERHVLTRKEDITAWLDAHNIEGYTLRQTDKGYVVDVAIDVFLQEKNLHFIPIQFGRVEKDFRVKRCNLLSLEGSPEIVMGDFISSQNKLKTLHGGPKYVGKDYYCCSNYLSNLDGAPEKVMRHFYCQDNKIKTLKTSTPMYVEGLFNCTGNKLSNLVGAQERYGNSFICSNNPLVSLMGCPKEIEGDFMCDYTSLSSVKHLPNYVKKKCYFSTNNEIDHILELSSLYKKRYETSFHRTELIEDLKVIQEVLLKDKLQTQLKSNPVKTRRPKI